MADLDLDALEAAAMVATAGPWMREVVSVVSQSDGRVALTGKSCLPYSDDDERERNANFIAAANPAVVLELVRRLRELEQQLAAANKPPAAADVEWVVNDMGELGVRVKGVCYFCYKGESLVYEHGIHDGNEPILHRNVGKREFGEVVYPAKWQAAGHVERRYTEQLIFTQGLSFGYQGDPRYVWTALPVLK